MYQVSRPLGLIWLDLFRDKWFRVGLAVKLGVVNSNDVIEIQGVKHAQIYNIA